MGILTGLAGWLGARLITYGLIALAALIGLGSLYGKGYFAGRRAVLEDLELQDAKNIEASQRYRDRASESGSLERLRKQFGRN